MKILVLCDDFWHPGDTIQKGLAGLENSGFQFDWILDAKNWSAERMAAYPAVILSKANNISSADETHWMTETVQNTFLEYVQKGNGLLVLHSGTAGYMDAFILRALIGGVFKEHPEQCQVTVEPLIGHPLTVGCTSFKLMDEHYFMVVDDPQVDVFMFTKSKHGTQPGGWRRYEGNGRVCVLTPGHNLDVIKHPSFQRLMRNNLNWCAQISEVDHHSQ